MTKDPATESQQATEVLALRSLGPKYEPKLHSRHVAVLIEMLTETTDNPAKNVALAGHYGSGKSSVILGLQAELTKRKVPWVNLSLSSLGIDDTKRARVQDDGSVAPLTNLIQKEIVKQLLYRKAPSEMPGSRYFRIDSFQWKPAAWWSAASGLMFVVVAVLFGLVKRVQVVAPQKVIGTHGWVPWLTVGVLGAFVGVIVFFAMRSLQNRFSVDSVSAGGAAVQLSKPANSYFDEYLDEIVYFFQKTKTQVAIFEDLDRFKDPHIFETLRELNTVLNNSEQLSSRPVRFVYAVRDSIFEQLDRSSADPDEDPSGNNATAASALESAPFANRTKFFDLVVPIVPFITHRSARDLVVDEFAEANSQPDAALVNLVGARLTDMRLIRNIRNEFEIYRASILGADGLKGLTADRLFAMMVYKNLHLEDFEAIRHGRSKIDAAHRAYREMVAHQTTHQAQISQTALNEAGAARLWDKRSQSAGERLIANLAIVSRGSNRGGQTVLVYEGTQYPISTLAGGPFWRALFESRGAAVLHVAGWTQIQLSFDEILGLAGESAAAMEQTVNSDEVDLRRLSRAALKTKDDVGKATMAQLMARTDLTMSRSDGEKNLAEIAAGLVSPLAYDLIAAGYIDENFTLYCSDYHSVAISLSAMNFILHCVQPNVSDSQFKFDEPASIGAVAAETGSRFFDGESVFNVEVFDYYLASDPDSLESAFEKLAVRVASETTFVDAYLVGGRRAKRFVSVLAKRWPGIFVHLVEKASLSPHSRVALVDAALKGGDPDVRYETTQAVQQFIADNYSQMGAFTEESGADVAARTAYIVGTLRVHVGNLSLLNVTQRQAVVAAGLYPVTRPNLEAAVGGQTSMALDALAAANGHVRSHVLANLSDYLTVLQDDEVTVENPDQFLTALTDVLRVDESHLVAVAERAATDCEVDDLSSVDEKVWDAVVSAGRFACTAGNVAQFVKNFGVTSPLAQNLANRSITDPDDVEEADRVELAYGLADSADLPASDRVRLIGELDLADMLQADQLSDTARVIIPAMLTADLLPDDAETYAAISDEEYSKREDFYAASSELADFVTELPLSASDLPKMMKSPRVVVAVKRAMVDDVEFVRGRLSRAGALAICEWAGYGHAVSVPLLIALSEAHAPAGHILGLLGPHLSSIALDDLDAVLSGLGDEYEPLTRRGNHRPKLKPRPGTDELLDELKRRGRVSSHISGMLGIRVHMRH